MAEVLDRAGKLYLAIGIAVGLLAQPLSPGDPEQQLARHLAAVQRLLERTPAGSREKAAEDVGRYMQRHGPAVARLKQQLRRYSPARSVVAYRKLERCFGPLMDAARPRAGSDLYRLLLDLLP